MSSVGLIIPNRIARQQAPHHRGYRRGAGSEKEVKMVRQKCPCIAYRLRLLKYLSQPPDEVIPVRIAFENLDSLNPPCHDMVQGTGCIYPRFPWHAKLITTISPQCQVNKLTTSPISFFRGVACLLSLASTPDNHPLSAELLI